MKFHSLRGMKDILPSEGHMWQFVEKVARRAFERFGYDEIRTPLLEEAGLFQHAIGEGTDIVNKEMYTFTDKGKRPLTLRPEGTAPIIRSYIENNMGAGGLTRLYYIGPMFRSERPQKGRSRQFHQIGIEAIGSPVPHIDAEAIRMMTDFFSEIGLKGFKIKLCSLGCAKDKSKLAKELRMFLYPEKNRLCGDCKIRLKKNVLRVLDCKIDFCKSLLRNSPRAKDFLCSSCSGHYNKVKGLLAASGIGFREEFNMVRGLDYYTNTVFEVTHERLGAQDAIAAGGRYDNLVEEFGGKKTGAFGFAIGVERLFMALSSEIKTKFQKEKRLDVYAATTSNDLCDKAFDTINQLRKKGIYCEINYHDRSLKSQMRQANKKNAAFVAIFGEEELKRGKVVLRDMKTSGQRNVPLSELSEAVRNEIKEGS